MIERYTLPEMSQIWSMQHHYECCLEVEVVTAEVMGELGIIPSEAAQKIRQHATISYPRIKEIEERTRHDMLAFLENIAESLGEESKYVHLGLTSNDVKDTAQGMQLHRAGKHILKELELLTEAVADKAKEHKQTIMVGRTHGIHAEPITFGLKLAVWYEELLRQKRRFEFALADMSVGQLSGAVGTYANIDPRVETMVCERLGLTPSPITTQVIQRDRHAFFVSVLANIAATLDKFATEFRNLQRTDILEVEEAFRKGQKGSSAMPHKKNPITSEQISGLSRVVRSNVQVAFENVPLWHERDIAHSSTERIILPDSTTLVHYMLRKMTGVIENLVVHKENMMRNLDHTFGLVFSQRILLALVEKGLLREQAYEIVQSNALKAWQGRTSFQQHLLEDPRFTEHMNENELQTICQYENFLQQVSLIFQRIGLE